MANELKGLGAGLIAGLAVVGASYGVSAVVSHNAPAQAAASKQAADVTAMGGAGAASSQLIAAGRGLYLANCVSCHGPQAQGQIGPTLHKIGDPDAKIARNIANGFPPRMPAYKGQLSAGQINTLVAYIQSLK